MTTDVSSGRRAAHDFTQLTAMMQAHGLLARTYARYWTRFATLNLVLVGVAAAFFWIGDSWWQLVVAAVLAVVLGQVMFLGHDAAHRQIFRSGRWNDWASLVIANLYAGMSYGWWQHKHSRHHAKPNTLGADGDIAPDVIVFSTANLDRARTGAAGWFAQRQGWLFFPLLLLEGLNLHVTGVRRLVRRPPVKRRAVEIAFLSLRLGGYVAVVLWFLPLGLAVAFLAVQLGLFGVYMGASFAPNHKGMPIVPATLKIDFLHRQVLLSRNITGGRLVDLFMGGLNHQVEHHLFPSMPSSRLRAAAPIVRQFCASRDIPYTETTLLRSYAIVVRYLNEVGLASRDPFQCPLVAQRLAA